jgi:hypothetical protein
LFPFYSSFDEENSGVDNPVTVIHRAVDNLFTAIKIVAEPARPAKKPRRPAVKKPAAIKASAKPRAKKTAQ